MESLDFNSSIESDGLQFQGFVSQKVLQVSPVLMLEPLQFQIGLRIKNNTSAPIRVNLFDTLNCTLVNADGSVTQCHAARRSTRLPVECDFPILSPGETWLYANRASLSLFVEGYELGWMTHWWRRFLKSVNPDLAYSSVRWETERPISLSISRGDGVLICGCLKLGLHQIALTYYNDRSWSELYDRTTESMKPVENLWVGDATDTSIAITFM